MKRAWLGLAVLVALGAACSPGDDVVIADTDDVAVTVADTEPPATEPPDTEPPDTEPPDTEPVDTEPEPPDTEPPDTEPTDTLPPDDPNSSTTVVDAVTNDDLYPLGTEVLVDEVSFKVTEFLPDASALYDTSYLEVPEGWVVTAVRGVVTNYSPGPSEFWYPDPLLVRPDGTGYPIGYCYGPAWLADLTSVSLMPGGTADTTTCFLLPADAVGDVALRLAEFGAEPDVFALQPGQGARPAAPVPGRPAVPAPGSSPPGSWKTPVALGSPAEAPNYTVSVTGVNEALPLPGFATAPPEGWRYVGVDLEVTFTGTNVEDAGFAYLAVVGDSGRMFREDYECQFDDADDPFEAEPGVPQAWSRCFVVPDVDLPSLELAFQSDFSAEYVFLALR